MSRTTREFLTRCFATEETIALLLRRENQTSVKQRVVQLGQALGPRYQAWLTHENNEGANVYVAANPLQPGSRKRTKESIASVRHLYIDIDDNGDARLAALVASDFVPTPTTILSTSPGKYQVLWRVAKFDFDQQEETLRLLAAAFGGDPACTDRNRVLRLPGFLNWKYDPAYPVAVEYPGDSVWAPADFRLDPALANSTPYRIAASLRKSPRKHSHSESDWAWVCDQLNQGTDPIKLTQELASMRSEKPNPIYYAQRTVDIASARLWHLEGIPIDNIVARLKERRSSEIPTTFCAARAREIAATALRMIGRKKAA